MKIGVLANDDQWKELSPGMGNIEIVRMDSIEKMPLETDAYICLQDDMKVNFEMTSKPILINSVCHTLKEMDATTNVIRFNGWNSFLNRSSWEMSGIITEPVLQIFEALGKKIILVPDEPGFISARIIAMIINEAYFAIEDKISTREEIDIAMKLGTNYPYGPFEWAGIIGIKKIFSLLEVLCIHDKRYLPATLLKAASTT